MRKISSLTIALIFSTASAFAADVPETDDVIEFDNSRFDWTGVYAGLSIGYIYVEDDDAAFPVAPGVTIPLHSEGENNTFGAFVGYTYHDETDWVYGAEYEYIDLDTQFIGDGIGPLPIFLEDAHAIRARMGYAFNDQIQAYGFAGAMHTSINIGLSDWTPIVGAGVDFNIDENIFVGGQYTHSWFEGYDGQLIDGRFDYFSFRVGFKF